MRTLIVWLAMLMLASSGFAQGMRFSLPREQVDQEDSLAEPGGVPVPLSGTNVNLEIMNWATALTPTPERGQFIVKLRQPARVGSILVYAKADVSTGRGNQWTKLAGAVGEAATLQLLAVSPEPGIDSIKLVAPPQRQPDNIGYRAVIPFLTLLPVRATNIAPVAEISSSSGNAKLLINGVAEESETVVAEAPGTKSNAWIKLTWKEPQSFRGLALLGGRDPTLLEDLVLEFSSSTNGAFFMIDGRGTDPGEFRKIGFFVTYQPTPARVLRVRHRLPQKPLRLGEILVFQELPQTPSATAGKKP